VAKTIAIAVGEDSSRRKEVHRLGSQCSTGQANTYKTFSSTTIWADGSGFFELKRKGEIIHSHKWGPE
jgi:hypothetical protein